MAEWNGSEAAGETGPTEGDVGQSSEAAPDSDLAVGSVVFERVRGASLAAALLLTARVARRVEEDVLRLITGRVVFVPLAERVVVVPSAFFT